MSSPILQKSEQLVLVFDFLEMFESRYIFLFLFIILVTEWVFTKRRLIIWTFQNSGWIERKSLVAVLIVTEWAMLLAWLISLRHISTEILHPILIYL